jgi:hypothetical protein
MIMSLSLKPVVSKRPFIVRAYFNDAHGVPRPNKPLKCPFFMANDEICVIHVDRLRVRICGISFRLVGMHCHTHRRSFTIYPPGAVPYGRQLLLLVDHAGGEVFPEGSQSPLQNTLFNAALDASNELLWPEEVQLGPLPEGGVAEQSRRTQRRHIAGALRLLGLNTSATLENREVVASHLNIGVTRLEAGAKKVRDGPSLIVQGMEAVQVLEQLSVIRLMMIGLLTLGVNQGYWGPALLQ